MRGEVEIYSGDKLLLHEPNMLVDGVGVLLADIMTVSPSLSGIEDHATSSILDASNYIVQAISFGTGELGAVNNASRVNEDWWNWVSGSIVPSVGAVGLAANAVATSAFGLAATNLSSYVPMVGVPTYPDPALEVLEKNTSVSAQIPISNAVEYAALPASALVAVSSVFPGNGQLTNFVPSAIASAMCGPTVFSSLTESWVGAGSVMGAFPEGSGTPTNKTRYYIFRDETYTAGDTAFNNNFYDGVFNAASSMDVSGFVSMVMSSVPNSVLDMSSTYSGLCLSAASDFADTGIVEYSVTLGAGDLGMANLYGGIYHLGLWTLDLKNSLLGGNTPPYAFSVLDNPRKYRLFARKGVSKNLCAIGDSGAAQGHENYTDLTIKWRLHFL
jgi:hypothetical protein